MNTGKTIRLQNFIVRLVINAIALGVTVAVVPGMTITANGLWALPIVAAVFGVVNAIVKPVVVVLTLPLTIVSLGLFIFVVNGLMLLLTTRLTGGLITIEGFLPALVGGVVMGTADAILETIVERFGWSEAEAQGQG